MACAPEGVLLALGSVLGGWCLYVRDGRLRYVHNLYGKERHVVGSDAIIAPGTHALGFAFRPTGDFAGVASLWHDGKQVGEGVIPHFTPMRFSITGGGLTCGYEAGPAIGDDYRAPFRFNAVIRRVVVDVSGDPHRDPAAEFEAMMSEQ